ARAAKALEPANAGTMSAAMVATLMATRVRGLVNSGMNDQALQIAEEAVTRANASGSVDAVLRSRDARLFALMHVSDMSEAVKVGVQLVEAAESSGDVHLATRGRLNAASVLNHLGMFEEAQAML